VRRVPPGLAHGAWALVAGALIAGCAVGPNFHRPEPPKTDRYTSQPLPEAGATDTVDVQRFLPGSNPAADWWHQFGSQDIDMLVAQALLANPTLRAAEATLRQSLENVAAQRGAYFPTLQAQADATRNRDAVQVLSPVLTSGAATYSLFTPQLSVAFVPDLFGGNRRQVESLRALADVSRDEYDAAYLTLIANVVSAAIQEAGLRAQIEATQQVIDFERESLDVMRRQLELGAIAGADVLAQETALAQIESTLPPLQKALDQQHDLLAVLTGRLPSDAPPTTLQLEQLHLPDEIPLGVPSQLVERRPDVRAAEAQLHAATADVGVAIADMLPQITLSGSIGTVATQGSQIFAGMNEFWTVGASLSQTLFAGGSLYHRERAARAALDAAGAQYRFAVLTAFQNVADALRALAADADAVRTQQHAYDAATQSLAIARSQFTLGSVSYLALLSAQQSFQQAIIGRAQALMNRYSDTAALYQALGGVAPNELQKSH
jgi:NodT family efflux transporter outer membrane factor (OMF) lipoprotein